MSGTYTKLLPYAFMVLAALSRWPGLFPPNFSAFYGLAFCSGAFFPGAMRWWLPLSTLLITDAVLNVYYGAFSPLQLMNYAAFGLLIAFGTRFSAKTSFLKLLSGGIVGAIFFYFFTNTVAWLLNPFGNVEYTKDLTGWLTALTKGTAGYPTTIEFFINTLLSGGFFTGLFAGVMKLTAAKEPAEKEAEEEAPEAPEEAPEESKA